MAVIARSGAEPLDVVLPAPGRGGLWSRPWVKALEIVSYISCRLALPPTNTCSGLQPRISANSALGRGQAGQLAVVAHVDAVDNIVLRLLEHIEDVRYHVQLILAGLAAGHVQLQPLCLQICKSGLQCCVFRPPLVQCHVFVCSHLSHPLRVVPEVLCGAKAPVNNLLYYTHLLAEIQGLFLSRIIKIPGKRGKILRFSFLFSKNMLQSTKMTAISAQGGPFWKINSKRSIN